MFEDRNKANKENYMAFYRGFIGFMGFCSGFLYKETKQTTLEKANL